MSDQSLPLDPDAAAEPDDVVLRRLARALDYAEGFWLGFARANSPAQRRGLVGDIQALLQPLNVGLLEIELAGPVADLLPILRERLAGAGRRAVAGAGARGPAGKTAVFVYGLEHSIPSREAYPPLLSSLNLNRELFRRQIPHPLVLWLPEYALTALARKAPDFWAWRSGLYEFPPARKLLEQSYESVRGEALHVTGGLSEAAKRERLAMLRGLFEDYRELGDGAREREAQANLLNGICALHQMLGEWGEAERLSGEALSLYRELGSEWGVSATLLRQGILAHDRGRIHEARRLYDESLAIKKRLGDGRGVSYVFQQLGRLAHDTGEPQEAQRLYRQALEIQRRLGDEVGIGVSLHALGRLAQDAGCLDEARRLYDESLAIERKFGDHGDIAYTLHQLGMLAERAGESQEAERLYRESFQLRQKLGDRRGVSISLHALGKLAQDAGRFDEARRLCDESLEIKKQLGDWRGIAYTLLRLGRLAQDTGETEEARRLYGEALEIMQRLGDRLGAALTLEQMARLGAEAGDEAGAARLYREALDIFEKLGSPDADHVRRELGRLGASLPKGS